MSKDGIIFSSSLRLEDSNKMRKHLVFSLMSYFISIFNKKMIYLT